MEHSSLDIDEADIQRIIAAGPAVATVADIDLALNYVIAQPFIAGIVGRDAAGEMIFDRHRLVNGGYLDYMATHLALTTPVALTIRHVDFTQNYVLQGELRNVALLVAHAILRTHHQGVAQ